MIKRIVDLHQPVAAVDAAFGVSERAADKWLVRFRTKGSRGLLDRSSRAAGGDLKARKASTRATRKGWMCQTGIHAKRIYSDHGSCYRSRALRAARAALGLKQRFTRPSTPKDQGQSRALHPNLPPRVGLRSCLFPLRSTRLTPPLLPLQLQLASPSPLSQSPRPHLQTPPTAE